MKQLGKRLLSLLLCVALAFPVPVVEAEAVGLDFLDMTRVQGTEQHKSYKALCSFGSMTIEGELDFSGSYTQNQINQAAQEALDKLGLTWMDMEDAQKKVDDWEEDEKITDEDVKEWARNIAELLGVDFAFDLASNIYDFVRSEKNGWQSILEIASGLSEYVEKDLRKEIITWAVTEGMVEAIFSDNIKIREAGTVLLEAAFEGNGKVGIGKISIPMKSLWAAVINGTIFSAKQFVKDQERKARMFEAIRARAKIREYYEVLNDILAKMSPGGTWVLTAAGGQTREFNFFGSEGNKQYLTMIVLGSKSTNDRLYAYRGDGANLPYGTYYGTAAIRLEHNMTPFDAGFWNLKMGPLPKGWMNKMIAAGAVAGGMDVDRTDYTLITRTLTADHVSFTLGGGYSYQYNDMIPATTGNRDIKGTIPLYQFKDEVKVDSVHKMSYLWGLVTEDGGAYEYVDMDIHANFYGANMDIIADNAEAYCNILGIEIADVNQKDLLVANVWDDNIWANMSEGIAIEVKTE